MSTPSALARNPGRWYTPEMIRAAMDIGSNTVRVLCLDIDADIVRPIHRDRRITRLSGKFDGRLSPDSVERTVAAARELAGAARALGVAEIRVGCTGVIRRAQNAGEFLARLRVEAGIEPVVIAGEIEGALSAAGTRHSLGDDGHDFLMIDIGGFSTELVAVDDRVRRRASFDVGVVALTERLLRGDPPTASEIDAVRREARAAIAPFFAQPVPPRLVGIAGTATTLAAMDLALNRFDPAPIHRHVISAARLDALFAEAVSMRADDRLSRWGGLERGREDLIVAGMLIIEQVLAAGAFSEVTIALGSLLEGIALAAMWPPDFDSNRKEVGRCA
ncbi:hypothetical protein K8I61_00685 [bacterium]|nr:hypothetical protein [bacterium]